MKFIGICLFFSRRLLQRTSRPGNLKNVKIEGSKRFEHQFFIGVKSRRDWDMIEAFHLKMGKGNMFSKALVGVGKPIGLQYATQSCAV